ncbi:putative CCR4-associated factor 1 homolog 6 [Wolffia australiana]
MAAVKERTEVAAAEVRQVWASNLYEELPRFMKAVELAPFAAIDTEFPGFVHHTPFSAESRERYEDVRRNVDGMHIVQLGVSLLRPERQTLHLAVQLQRLRPVLPSHLRWDASVELLKNSESTLRGRENQWMGMPKPVWVTYHGLYDVAYLVKLLTGKPLPRTLPEFARLVGCCLGDVVDVKHLSRFIGGFHLGLSRLSEFWGVEVLDGWDGTTAHQAGVDSLRTGAVYLSMLSKFDEDETDDEFHGVLFGIEEEKIAPPSPPPPPRFVKIGQRLVYLSKPWLPHGTGAGSQRVPCLWLGRPRTSFPVQDSM